jgi:hypothetical protein
MDERSSFRRAWLADEAPRMILVHLDGAGPYGDPYQINSANNGPYGDAVVHELIPRIEREFRGRGEGAARVLDGVSTGGWVALALQTFYPQSFGGAWARCPDSVDFRAFQLLNIYEDANAYVADGGAERPAAANRDGSTRFSMREEVQLENTLGRGNRWTMSGRQWGAWNAAYGPRGADGLPAPLWDPGTGVMNRAVVGHWRRYDLRLVLEQNWDTLGPTLGDKLHVWAADDDDYFLDESVRRLEAFLRQAVPPFEGTLVIEPGRHCDVGPEEAELMELMGEELRRTLTLDD